MPDRPHIHCPTETCKRMMDPRSRVCHSCAVAVQKRTFTIPKRRQPVIMPYFEERRRMKRYRSM